MFHYAFQLHIQADDGIVWKGAVSNFSGQKNFFNLNSNMLSK